MMRLARSSAVMPSLVVEALRRRGRNARRNPNNNYIAVRRASAGCSLGKSILAAAPKRMSRKPGAPAGNRNAQTCGLYTAAMKARRAHFRAFIARLRLARALTEQILALNLMQARRLGSVSV